VSAIAGFAEALKLAVSERADEAVRIREIRDYCLEKLEQEFSGKFILNGSIQNRLPNNINVTFKGFDSELLVIELDAKGISVSEKSACNTEDESSYVIDALGNKGEKGSIRISFGKYSKKSDADFLVKNLQQIFEKYKNI
jgi:cysteine desulfurase